MKKIINNLLFKVFCGIVLGIILGRFAPEVFLRIFVTFKEIFGNFLAFSIPLIIIGLVMPSIAELGKNAGKLLILTIGVAYFFTLFSGFSTYFISENIFPVLLTNQFGSRE